MVDAGLIACVVRVLCGVAAALLMTGIAAAADEAAPVKHERFGNWDVACVKVGQSTRCSVIQQQATSARSGQGSQRTFALELLPARDGVVGTLLTPFGLDVTKGVVLRLDKAGPPLLFKTCLSTGCIVPLQFGNDAIRALRSHPVLHVSFVIAGDGRTGEVPISLGGLGQALDRARAIESTNVTKSL